MPQPDRNPNPEEPPVPPISETQTHARMPLHLREAVLRIAAHHGRTASDELRRALELWTAIAAVASNLDPDVIEGTEPAIREGRLHELHRIAIDRIGDAFPAVEPEEILATLAGASAA